MRAGRGGDIAICLSFRPWSKLWQPSLPQVQHPCPLPRGMFWFWFGVPAPRNGNDLTGGGVHGLLPWVWSKRRAGKLLFTGGSLFSLFSAGGLGLRDAGRYPVTAFSGDLERDLLRSNWSNFFSKTRKWLRMTVCPSASSSVSAINLTDFLPFVPSTVDVYRCACSTVSSKFNLRWWSRKYWDSSGEATPSSNFLLRAASRVSEVAVGQPCLYSLRSAYSYSCKLSESICRLLPNLRWASRPSSTSPNLCLIRFHRSS